MEDTSESVPNAGGGDDSTPVAAADEASRRRQNKVRDAAWFSSVEQALFGRDLPRMGRIFAGRPDVLKDMDAVGRCSLLYAQQYWPEAIPLLIEHGADPNRLSKGGRSALDLAYLMGSGGVVRQLLGAGARLAEMDGTDGARLALAALAGDRTQVDALLAQVAQGNTDVNARDCYGGTALHRAARSADAVMVAHLLACGADVDAAHNDAHDAKDGADGMDPTDAWGTPLVLTADERHAYAVRRSLEQLQTGEVPPWVTPLMCAAVAAGSHRHSKAEAHKTMRTLIDAGADVRGRPRAPGGAVDHRPGSSYWGTTPLAISAALGDPEDVEFLLGHSAGKRREDLLEAMHATTVNIGCTGWRNQPVLWAAGRRRLDPPLRLVEVMPHVTGDAVRVLLGEAKEFEPIVPLSAADLNEADPATGDTPLLWAIRHLRTNKREKWGGFTYDVQHVEMLLRHGADPKVRDRDGRTARDLARARGMNECAAMLRRLMRDADSEAR
jgi:ankyrin repeat protein